jgi:DNA topoisomerase-1
VSGKPVVGKEGRFGDYVTDGETNAGLTRGDRMENMTNERAYELLQMRREYIAENGGPKKRSGNRRASGPAKSATKKTAAKKPAAKKAAAKKKPAKKTAAKKPAAEKNDADKKDGE